VGHKHVKIVTSVGEPEPEPQGTEQFSLLQPAPHFAFGNKYSQANGSESEPEQMTHHVPSRSRVRIKTLMRQALAFEKKKLSIKSIFFERKYCLKREDLSMINQGDLCTT
jgi:hypothetical protein